MISTEFLVGLLYDTCSIEDYIASNRRVLVKEELEITSWGAVASSLRQYLGICLNGLKETQLG
jgi:hypothetical protein